MAEILAFGAFGVLRRQQVNIPRGVQRHPAARLQRAAAEGDVAASAGFIFPGGVEKE
ncbi:hypothetical protein OMR58_23185 [Erwinia sp. INIA-01]|uniref:hypothetical protein n=1 Tax=Erwinia sp. INIA01 TaxID=2991500 RepID=UPI00222552C5|nr:hypothetical protein [Erwinia sp. INIA01]MCW1877352.1 hypothetical protein [Erwinia sp. INIA01]